MEIEAQVREWAKGCSNTQPTKEPPWKCKECTDALLEALYKRVEQGDLECRLKGHTPMTRHDGVVVCKDCGITQGPQPAGECQAPGCRVQLFDPKEEFCQHHEGNRIFGVE